MSEMVTTLAGIARIEFAWHEIRKRSDDAWDVYTPETARACYSGPSEEDCQNFIWRKVIREVLKAMRQPNREMLESYIRHMGYDPKEEADSFDKLMLGVGVVAKYQSFIDGALS